MSLNKPRNRKPRKTPEEREALHRLMEKTIRDEAIKRGLVKEYRGYVSIVEVTAVLCRHLGLDVSHSPKRDVRRLFMAIKGYLASNPPTKQKLSDVPYEQIRDFYNSWEWKRARYDALIDNGTRCQCCGCGKDEARIVVDHIKPVRYYWHLRLDRRNLQVLCDNCNMGKGSHDQTDWRDQRSPGQRIINSLIDPDASDVSFAREIDRAYHEKLATDV